MSATHCLNCDMPLQGAYCHSCGQKGNTHRLSMKHFIAHDLVHGLWHLDGSLPRTLKNILLRPGRTAVAYLAGKRAGQFNLITLMLILIGLNIFVNTALFPEGRTVRIGNATYGSTPPADSLRAMAPLDGNGASRPDLIKQWIENNSKWIILGTIPVLSVVSVTLFRRRRYNYAEHLVISSYFLTGVLLLRLLLKPAEWVLMHGLSVEFSLAAVMALVYLGVLYWQIFRQQYTLAGWGWRVSLIPVLFGLLFVVAMLMATASYLLVNGRGLDGLIEYDR